jgi:hypothetical protein
MILGTFSKQPVDRYDYDIDYSEWLTERDNVESVVVSILPNEDLMDPVPVDKLEVLSVTVMDPIVKLWIDGGRNGITYKVTLTMTTADGRIKQDEFKLKVKDI